MIDIKKHLQIALGYFLIIAFLGVLLRLFHIIDVPVNYRFMVHSHSHVALLGWLYTALTSLIYYVYLRDKPIAKKYKITFWSTQLTIIGMMISFPFTGYAFFSILFSTLFLFASYFFTFLFFKYTSEKQKEKQSYKLIRLSLWYMILSSLGPWALGVIMSTLGSGSDWYRNAIYFYLHFQYNGWFIVCLCGFLFVLFENYNLSFNQKTFKRFYFFLNSGVILTFFLSILWMKPPIIFFIAAGIGAIFQGVAFAILFRRIKQKSFPFKNKLSKLSSILLQVSALFLIFKLFAQLIGALPKVAQIVSSNIDFVIGYIHWTFLGVVSVAILGFLNQLKLIHISKGALWTYLIFFLFTEGCLFYKGMIVWQGDSIMNNYYELLTIASFGLFVSIAILFTNQFQQKRLR